MRIHGRTKWLAMSVGLMGLIAAACGPAEVEEEEGASSALKLDCILTDDLTDVCSCANNMVSGVTYALGSTRDVDFVRVRVGDAKGAQFGVKGPFNLSFATLSPPEGPSTDTYCTLYDSSCRAVATAESNPAGGTHCMITTGGNSSAGTVDFIFAVSPGNQGWPSRPRTGPFQMSAILNGHGSGEP